MQKKIYKINENNFSLKEDLTVEESEEVQELLNDFYSSGENGIIPHGGIRRFLSLVLCAENNDEQTLLADFGKAKESVVLEVIKDFFLRRMRLTASMADYFRNLAQEQNLPSGG